MSGGSRGTFKVRTDNVRKLRSYILSLLKKHRYTVNEDSVDSTGLSIVATRGNKLLHYATEQLLEYIPMSDMLGWAVRVQVSFGIRENTEEGCYTLLLSSEPASNELNPVEDYLSRNDPRTLFEAVGEDEKCREAFELFARAISRSPYAAE